MHQPDSLIQKIMMLNYLKQKILIISIPIENQWKVPWRNLDMQMGGHQTSAISFYSSHFGKLILTVFWRRNIALIRDIKNLAL